MPKLGTCIFLTSKITYTQYDEFKSFVLFAILSPQRIITTHNDSRADLNAWKTTRFR